MRLAPEIHAILLFEPSVTNLVTLGVQDAIERNSGVVAAAAPARFEVIGVDTSTAARALMNEAALCTNVIEKIVVTHPMRLREGR